MTLRHLTLGAHLEWNYSWDHPIQLAAIQNLTQLELSDTHISHVVLFWTARLPRSLMLHSTFEELCSANVLFSLRSDPVNNVYTRSFPTRRSSSS